jgi:lipopolysaccharide biosynthesis regulator YciM
VTWLWTAAAAVVAVLALLDLRRARRRRDEARAWARGVRSVLSDDSDSAIAALSDAARLGSEEAIDTYLALGALFRRTGDLARAVRLHRNMLVYPGLDPGRAAEVERELAEDYRRSGMLAEAIELLEPRASSDRGAAELLRDVVADQGRWAAAAEVQRRLGEPSPDPILAHLWAAAARSALDAAPGTAEPLARRALEADPASADGLLALAEVEAAAGRWTAATGAIGRALAADPRCAVLAWPALARVRDHAASLALLEGAIADAPTDGALRMLHGRILHAAGRNGEALEAFRRALELDELGEVTVAMRDLLRAADAPGPSDLAARHDLLVAALLKKARAPRCSRCGTEAVQRQWRCRRCGQFDPHR